MGKKITLYDQIEPASVYTIKARWPEIYNEIWKEGYHTGRIDAVPEKQKHLAAAAEIGKQNEVIEELARVAKRNVAKFVRALSGQADSRQSYGADERFALVITDFIETCIEAAPAGSRVAARDVYATFAMWWRSVSGEEPPSQRKFGLEFRRRFRREKRAFVFYFGLQLSAKGRAFQVAGKSA